MKLYEILSGQLTKKKQKQKLLQSSMELLIFNFIGRLCFGIHVRLWPHVKVT